jgi:hypothetical protein
LVAGFVKVNYLAVSTLTLGNVAGSQFDNSDKSYLISNDVFWGFGIMNSLVYGLPVLILLIIWWSYFANLKKAVSALSILIIGMLMLTNPQKSYAYFNTTDKTEAIQILPNESAFWIPDVGANKDSQTKLDSEEYYNNNKVAIKRFIIPHQKLSGTGGTAWFSGPDSYVPTGRLILVDRTPQSREWVNSPNKGTSKADESFPCQSNEGLNISIGVSIGVSVREENAAKFLYNFGVLPTTVVGQDGRTYYADRSDPSVIFTSVYYGRSLAAVTDDVVRKKIQTLMCNEIGSRTFEDDNRDQIKIMSIVETAATKYLSEYGITLNFIGYADTWTFDPSVQKAINDRYEAAALKDSLPTLQATMQLKVQEGVAEGLKLHGFPIVITPDIFSVLENIGKSAGNVLPIPAVPGSK